MKWQTGDAFLTAAKSGEVPQVPVRRLLGEDTDEKHR
jgi:hypothetical protein